MQVFFHFVLANFQPALHSKMGHVQLATIANPELMKTYGADAVAEPIIKDNKT